MSNRYGCNADSGQIEADCPEYQPNYPSTDINLGQCTVSSSWDHAFGSEICPSASVDKRYDNYVYGHPNSSKTELNTDLFAEDKAALNHGDSAKYDSGICLSSFDSGIPSYCSGKASENASLTLSGLTLEPLVESVENLKLNDGEDTYVNTVCYSEERTSGVNKTEQIDEKDCRCESGFASCPEQDPSLYERQCQEIYTQDDDGDTQLHTAIVVDRPDAAMCMIQQYTPNPDLLNIFNSLKQTPLHLAVITDQWEVVRHLVVCGAQIDLRDRNGNTALHIACKEGRLNCVWALTHPIQPHEQQAVPYLVPKQCIPQDSTLQSYEGDTCLHLAARQRYMDILTYLIQSCHSDINAPEGKSGRTILHEATESNDLELVTFLTQQSGINLNVLTYDLCTPYQLAIGRGHRTVADCLTKAGANPDLRDMEDLEEEDNDDESQSDGSMVYDDILIGGTAISVDPNRSAISRSHLH